MRKSQFFSALALNLRATRARAIIRFSGIIREPSYLILSSLAPLASVAAYVYLYQALHTPVSYIGFIVLGGTIINFWLLMLWSMADQLFRDREMGLLETYIRAPASRAALLIGMGIGDALTASARSIFLIAASIIIWRITLTPTYGWLVPLIFLLTLGAVYALGMIACSLFLFFGRAAWHVVNLFEEPVYLAAGVYFPVTSIGRIAAYAASIIPLTLGLDAMRQSLFASAVSSGLLPIGWEIGLLALLTVVFSVLASVLVSWVEKQGLEKGSLVLRWI